MTFIIDVLSDVTKRQNNLESDIFFLARDNLDIFIYWLNRVKSPPPVFQFN